MIKAMAEKLGVIVIGAILGMSLSASAFAADEDSGFLKDYSQLKEDKDPLGNPRRLWISPKLTRENYHTILMERIGFYPAPEPSDQVPRTALNDIRDYADAALRKAIASVLPMTNTPGPGVARLRMAFTSVGIDKSLKPYQLIPTALIFTAITRASGVAKLDAKLFVEAEISDSVTGEPLARAVRNAHGVEVKADEKLTLGDVQSRLDEWVEAVRQVAVARLKPAGK